MTPETDTFLCGLIGHARWHERLATLAARHSEESDHGLGLEVIEAFVFDLADDPGGYVLAMTHDFRKRLDPERIGRVVRAAVIP